VTVLQHLCKPGPGVCIQKFKPVKGLLRLLRLHRLGTYKHVVGIYAAVLRASVTQPAFEEVIMKLYHQQKLPCLYEEHDFFSDYKLTNGCKNQQ